MKLLAIILLACVCSGCVTFKLQRDCPFGVVEKGKCTNHFLGELTLFDYNWFRAANKHKD